MFLLKVSDTQQNRPAAFPGLQADSRDFKISSQRANTYESRGRIYKNVLWVNWETEFVGRSLNVGGRILDHLFEVTCVNQEDCDWLYR